MLDGQNMNQTVKTLKIWIKCGNVSSKTQASLTVKLLTCREFHLGESKDFSKAVWIRDGLPPNSHLVPADPLLSVFKFLLKMTLSFHALRTHTNLAVCDVRLFPKHQYGIKLKSWDTSVEFQTTHLRCFEWWCDILLNNILNCTNLYDLYLNYRKFNSHRN